jgi:hypothetical protein
MHFCDLARNLATPIHVERRREPEVRRCPCPDVLLGKECMCDRERERDSAAGARAHASSSVMLTDFLFVLDHICSPR